MKLTGFLILQMFFLTSFLPASYGTPVKYETTLGSISVSRNQAYLNTLEIPNSQNNFLKGIFEGTTASSYEEIYNKISYWRTEVQQANAFEKYKSDLFKILDIQENKIEEWGKNHQQIYLGAIRYTSKKEKIDQITYREINQKLRDRTKMTSQELDFFNSVVSTINHIPKVKGLVFRGRAVKREQLQEWMANGGRDIDPAFLSTTIDPSMAISFANSPKANDPANGLVKTVFVIYTKGGAPISVFNREFQSEYEVLLRAGTVLNIKSVFLSVDGTRSFVFAEEGTLAK